MSPWGHANDPSHRLLGRTMTRAPRVWKLYEQQIFDLMRTKAPDAQVESDVRVLGKYSGVNRQIDVLVTGTFPGLDKPEKLVVECKALNRRVHVKDVEMTYGLLEDVDAALGILVTTKGHSRGATSRAFHCRGLSLEVVKFDDLAAWLPKKPTVAWTTNSDSATVTWWNDDRTIMRTDRITLELAQRLVAGIHGRLPDEIAVRPQRNRPEG
jgi:hypothetical protein